MRIVLALCVAAVSAAVTPAWAATPRKPNVVFIHSDDHGWADVGFRGSIIDTPRIDSLAAGGVVLDHYHTQPICSPTRVGLMTGRNPLRMGITGNFEAGEDGVPLDEHFLPQTFRAAGYQTWALGKWHLGGTTGPQYLPQQRGFDHFYGFVGGSITEATHMTPGTSDLDWQRNGTPVPEDDGQLSTDLLATEAVGLIAGRDPDRPFFLYLAFHALHTPYDAPQALKDKYAALGLSGQQLQYAAMAENMDANVGRVLDALVAQGIDAETLVVFASDNGADEGKGGSNLPLRGWKGEVFEGGNRTSAVMRWPGMIVPGTVSEQFVSHQDWLPTLAAAAGITPRNSKPLDGRDRWAAVLGGAAGLPQGYVVRRGQGTSVLDGGWKLLRTTNAGAWQLYDLAADPGETTDLAAVHPEVVAALAAYVDLIGMDADADLVPDDADVCTTLGVIAPPASPIEQSPEGLRLSLGNLEKGPAMQKLVAKGYFNPATTTPAIDPLANGVQVHLEGASGVLFDVSVPGGAVGTSACGPRDGWSVSGSPGRLRWKYVNASGGLPDGMGGCNAGAANGLTGVQVADRTATSRAAFSFKAKAKGATFAAIPARPLSRVQLDVVLGAGNAPGEATVQGMAGQCAEFRIEGDPVRASTPKPYCTVSPSSGPVSRIRCVGS